MNNKSLSDRKKQFIEDCCGGMGGGPTMSMGDAGYQSAAPAEGPMAGYDPMLGKKKKKSAVEMGKRLRKEGFMDMIKKFKDKRQVAYNKNPKNKEEVLKKAKAANFNPRALGKYKKNVQKQRDYLRGE